MGANPQSLPHLSCAVPLPAEIISFGGQWEVSEVRRDFVRRESRRTLLADWLDWLLPVLEADEVRLDMTAPVQWIAEGGTFEVHHNHLGGSRMVAMMAHNSDIIGLHHQSLVASLVSCGMGEGGKTGECLDMVAAKAGNYTLVVDEINLGVAQIACLCSVYFQHYCLMLPQWSSGCCCEPDSRPTEAILVVFSGDPFVDIVWKQMMVVNKFSI